MSFLAHCIVTGEVARCRTQSGHLLCLVLNCRSTCVGSQSLVCRARDPCLQTDTSQPSGARSRHAFIPKSVHYSHAPLSEGLVLGSIASGARTTIRTRQPPMPDIPRDSQAGTSSIAPDIVRPAPHGAGMRVREPHLVPIPSRGEARVNNLHRPTARCGAVPPPPSLSLTLGLDAVLVLPQWPRVLPHEGAVDVFPLPQAGTALVEGMEEGLDEEKDEEDMLLPVGPALFRRTCAVLVAREEGGGVEEDGELEEGRQPLSPVRRDSRESGDPSFFKLSAPEFSSSHGRAVAGPGPQEQQ